MQTPGNHQVQHQPQIALQADANPLADPPQADDFLSLDAGDWGYCRAQQMRRGDQDLLQGVSDNALLQRFDIDNDVRQLRHNFSQETVPPFLETSPCASRIKKARIAPGPPSQL